MYVAEPKNANRKKDEFEIKYFFCEDGKNIKVIIEEAFKNYKDAKSGI